MKSIAKLVLTIALFAGACSPPEDVDAIQHAITYVGNPYGDVPVNVFVGYAAANHQTGVLYRRISDNSCFWSVLGSPSANGQFGVYGSNYDDVMKIVHNYSTGISCTSGTWILDPPIQSGIGGPNGNILLIAMDGNDDLTCSQDQAGLAYNRCYGQNGYDTLRGYARSLLDGGYNNDAMIAYESDRTELYGAGDQDCLTWSQSTTPLTVDGGPGSDGVRSFSSSGGGGTPVNVEYITPNNCGF